jgi:type 1 fimbriae regulatory protein FimB/type 1 fimbriae regulatory protein FimE
VASVPTRSAALPDSQMANVVAVINRIEACRRMMTKSGPIVVSQRAHRLTQIPARKLWHAGETTRALDRVAGVGWPFGNQRPSRKDALMTGISTWSIAIPTIPPWGPPPPPSTNIPPASAARIVARGEWSAGRRESSAQCAYRRQRPCQSVRNKLIITTVTVHRGLIFMTKPRLKLVAPTTKKRTVTPTRLPNAELRTREYLTDSEVNRLMKAAGGNRWGHRDATMILVAYRHGLRVSELVDLRWDQIDFNTATMAVRRAKKGTPATHPIRGDEMRALRKLQREQHPKLPFVFTSERGSPFTTAGFARLAERAGKAAKLGFKAHPHMLRHACGYALANKGHDTRALQAYLGHKNIQHTVRYTELSPTRFKSFWRD